MTAASSATMLAMLRWAIRGSNGSAREVRFGVHVRNDNRDRTPPLVRLKAVCGPGDKGEPVFTVMLAGEGWGGPRGRDRRGGAALDPEGRTPQGGLAAGHEVFSVTFSRRGQE
jgi:hypothetical protein